MMVRELRYDEHIISQNLFVRDNELGCSFFRFGDFVDLEERFIAKTGNREMYYRFNNHGPALAKVPPSFFHH